MKSQLLLARSGKAITPAEYTRLSAFMPDVNDNQATANAKMDRLSQGLADAKASFITRATQAPSTIVNNNSNTGPSSDMEAFIVKGQ